MLYLVFVRLTEWMALLARWTYPPAVSFIAR
jgi:hypothetical protein